VLGLVGVVARGADAPPAGKAAAVTFDGLGAVAASVPKALRPVPGEPPTDIQKKMIAKHAAERVVGQTVRVSGTTDEPGMGDDDRPVVRVSVPDGPKVKPINLPVKGSAIAILPKSDAMRLSRVRAGARFVVEGRVSEADIDWRGDEVWVTVTIREATGGPAPAK
jgi:hypothetical protein